MKSRLCLLVVMVVWLLAIPRAALPDEVRNVTKVNMKTILIRWSPIEAPFSVCKSTESKKRFIENHYNEDSNTLVLVAPYDDGTFQVRYYPPELSCLVYVMVSETCELSNADTDVMGVKGLTKFQEVCWDSRQN